MGLFIGQCIPLGILKYYDTCFIDLIVISPVKEPGFKFSSVDNKTKEIIIPGIVPYYPTCVDLLLR